MIVADDAPFYDRRLVICSSRGIDEAEGVVDKRVVISRGAEKRVIDENRDGVAATESELERDCRCRGRGETKSRVG